MKQEYLFVYGTLRKQFSRKSQRIYLKNCRFITLGYIQAKLYEVKNYPGALASDHTRDKVYGEVYRINQAVLHRLDTYEECSALFPAPHEYQRLPLKVFLAGYRKPLCAWVYLYQWPVAGLKQIKSGDYYRQRIISS